MDKYFAAFDVTTDSSGAPVIAVPREDPPGEMVLHRRAQDGEWTEDAVSVHPGDLVQFGGVDLHVDGDGSMQMCSTAHDYGSGWTGLTLSTDVSGEWEHLQLETEEWSAAVAMAMAIGDGGVRTVVWHASSFGPLQLASDTSGELEMLFVNGTVEIVDDGL